MKDRILTVTPIEQHNSNSIQLWIIAGVLLIILAMGVACAGLSVFCAVTDSIHHEMKRQERLRNEPWRE